MRKDIHRSNMIIARNLINCNSKLKFTSRGTSPGFTNPDWSQKSFGDCLLKAICKRSFRKSCDDNILSYVISIFMKAVGRTLDMPGSAVQDVGAWRLYCSRLCIRYVAPSSESVSSQAYHAVSPTETAIT